ncbi:MAG: sialate O-acetylesterase [Clostridia bacterium]|nr:sialate O-acetylesterase [Clostridia bacterium]
MNGAFISYGVHSFEIFQQQGAAAAVELGGSCRFLENATDSQVYVRVVREDNGADVVGWQPAETEKKEGTEGSWRCSLRIPAGGLYRLETCLCADRRNIAWAIHGDMAHHIGVGEVFVIAGQSNAAGYGKDAAYDPPELGVHLLRNSGAWDIASHPLNDSTGTIHEENTEGANPGSSPYLSFAKQLRRELGLPIGLVQTSLGGSPLSAWNPQQNGVLYRMMLGVLEGIEYKIRGVLWYQGCTDSENSSNSETYQERFMTFVQSLRQDMGNASLPILTVQLNRFTQAKALNPEADTCWGSVREAQRQAAHLLEGVYIVPAADLALADVIHNSSSANVRLGERLAALALNVLYHRSEGGLAPDLASACRKEGGIELRFAHAAGGMDFYALTAQELPFDLRDEGGALPIESYRIEDDTFVLRPARELRGRAVISGASGSNPPYLLPRDIVSNLPMLSFCSVPIEEESCR